MRNFWAFSILLFLFFWVSIPIADGEQGSGNLELFKNGILDQAQAPGPGVYEPKRTLVLAGHQTRRPDILNGFKKYNGGWNMTNQHYWASVGFTGAAGFVLAVLWLVLFGVALVIYHCCGWKINVKLEGSENSQKICFTLLILFTCASIIGCIILSVGQDKFHGQVIRTLNYVMNQSDYTVQTLRNVTEYLSLAKTINLSQVILPPDVEHDIDELSIDLKSASQTLTEKTGENAVKIKQVFRKVRAALIVVAIIMLLLAVLGLALSLKRHRHAIYIFILTGWLLVAGTFILCGVFVIFNSAIVDTCTAMQEWANNPQAETALSDILPCVNERATDKTLTESKKIVAGIVNIVNQFIYTYADTNRSHGDIFYYNQSGPLVPPLCYPFNYLLEDRACGQQEVSMENASLVWESQVCLTENDTCITSGRLTPTMYGQLVTAVNVSNAIKRYTPPMLSLQNCNFVRDAFVKITSSYCPALEHYLRVINAGLGLISVGVMLCLVLWIPFADHPLMEDLFAKVSLKPE
ncbi:hypothetical protein V2J09_012770 [Rumex salicifolius]